MNPPKAYDWQGYRCTYDRYVKSEAEATTALLLIHPIGVGLSRHFWDRFCQQWSAGNHRHPLYVPDLLGCGDSAMPRVAYRPEDWAAQLQHFIETVVRQPVMLVVQGALFSVAIYLVQRMASKRIQGLVLAGPPGWDLMSQAAQPRQRRLLWNCFFNTPLGDGFYRYARREQFLASFSKRQLFVDEADVDSEWLGMLEAGSAKLASRFAIFSFLAGFWRRDYTEDIKAIAQPTLTVFGEQAAGIDKVSKSESAQSRLASYLKHLPNPTGEIIPGRNVLPYEAVEAFIEVVARWLETFPEGG